MPFRILAVLIGASAVVEAARTTWKLARDPRPAKDRLEQHIEESPTP
ncbi:hypothetical protein ACWGVR_29110 [Streptomyces xanthophaeus]